MTKLLGVLLLAVAAIAGVVGVGWIALDAVGTEWDYCSGGGCIAGWKRGVGVSVVAVAAGIVGFRLLRRGTRRRQRG